MPVNKAAAPERAIKKSRAADLRARLSNTRQCSLFLAKPLSDEDQVVQAMDDASPAKWHLAHTTWFFEAFLLTQFDDNYKLFSEDFLYCFISY